MLLRKLTFFLIFFACASVVSADGFVLNETDYMLKYTPTGETIVIGKSLNFTPNNAIVCIDHNTLSGQNYLGGITVYSKNYFTNRGIRIGDPIDKVKEYYGEPNRYSASKDEYKCLSYIDKQEVLKIHFYLDKETERVIAINLNIYPVGTPPMIKLADGEYH